MKQIPKLYDGVNLATIPKCILDELRMHSDVKSFTSTRNNSGEMITEWGDFTEPLFMSFCYEDLNFYVNQKYVYDLFKWLDLGYCFDSEFNKLDRNNIHKYYSQYSKGFNKSYFEFEKSLKVDNSLFSINDLQIAHKVYSQISNTGVNNKNGQFRLVNKSFGNSDIGKKICLQNNIKFTLTITERDFFESGLNGGKFYKAWEIILRNPTVFEPIFLKNKSEPRTKVEQLKQVENVSPESSYLNKYWFKIGLLFANGEMSILLDKHNRNATKIAEELGNKNYRPFISESTGFNKNSDKNIFNSKEKMNKIIRYCEENSITVISDFLERLPL